MSKTRPLTLIMLLAACSLSSCGRVATHIRAYPIQNPQGIAFESDPSFVEAYNLHLSLRNQRKPRNFENTVVGLPNIHELQEIDPQDAGWNVDIIYPKKSRLMESIDNAKLSIREHIEPLIKKFDSAAGTNIKKIIVPQGHSKMHNVDQEKVEQYPEGYKFDSAAGTNIKKIIVPQGHSKMHNVDQEKVEQYPEGYSKYLVEGPEQNIVKNPEQNTAKNPEQNAAAQTQYSPIDSSPANHTKIDAPSNTDTMPQCTEHLIYSTQPVISPPKKEKSRNKKKTENKEKAENKEATYDKPRVNKNKSKIDQPKSTIQFAASHPDKDREKRLNPNSNEPNKISQPSSLSKDHDTDLLPQEMHNDLHPDESSKTESKVARTGSDNHFSEEYMEWYNSVHSGMNMDNVQEDVPMQNPDHTNPENKNSTPFTAENQEQDRYEAD